MITIIKNMKFILIALVVALVIALGYSIKRAGTLRAERDRQTQNLQQITSDNATLNLTVEDYKKIHTQDTEKLDSVLKANKIRPRQVISATITTTVYKDTGSVKIIYREAEKQPDGTFKIPVGYSDQCWGFKGEILTKDQTSKFNLIERTASNSTQLVVVKPRYFLFIRLKKSEYKLFTDCGESKFTDIKFVKK